MLGDADVGAQISVAASFTDGHGTAEAVTSAATATVTNVNDAPAVNSTSVGQVAFTNSAYNLYTGIALYGP